MTRTATVIRFDPNGPNGLQEWPAMDPDELETDVPVQRGHHYHRVESIGLEVGVWDCTPFTAKESAYPVDEYMLFLDGGLTMVLPDGEEVEIKAGDAFIIPKGFVCKWKQHSFVLKYFMILDSPVPEADNPSLKRITVPDLTQPAGSVDVAETRTDFVNAAGTMSVNVSNYGAMSQPSLKMSANNLVTVLQGTLILNDGKESHSFGKGETAYIHQGGTVGWSTTAGTRLVTASYADPG